MSRTTVAVLSIFLSTIPVSAGQESNHEDLLKTRFENEALDAWSDFREQTKQLQGRFVHQRINHLDNGRVLESGSSYIKQSLPSCLLFVNLGDNVAQEVRGWSSRYVFQLNRDESKHSWVLGSYSKNRTPENDPESYDAFMARLWMCPAICIENVFLDDFVALRGFTLSGIEPLVLNGLTLAKLTFVLDPSSDKSKDRNGNRYRGPIRSGWIALDPNRLWTIVQYKCEVDWKIGPGTMSGSLEYRESEGFPLISRYSIINKSNVGSSNPYHYEDLCECEFTKSTVAESEFSLTAFGLPELYLDQEAFSPRSTVFWPYALIVVGGLVLLIFYVKNRSRLQDG